MTEVYFEAYPQLLINLTTMMSLIRFREPANILSAVISLINILFGLSENLSALLHTTDSAPFLDAFMAVFVDTLFRIFSIAYIWTSIDYFTFFFPVAYGIVMIVYIVVSFGDGFYYAYASFITSACIKGKEILRF